MSWLQCDSVDGCEASQDRDSILARYHVAMTVHIIIGPGRLVLATVHDGRTT